MIIFGATIGITLGAVNIDVGRQLFVDDYLISSMNGIVRHWNKPRKMENPVLWPGDGAAKMARTKDERPARLTCCSDGGIWWDPHLGKFRLWYQADWCGDLCYAESRDGITWEYPDLGIVPGTNRIFDRIDADSWEVFPDCSAADPYSCWKMHVSSRGGGSEDNLWTSDDGKHFTHLWTAGRSGDRSTAYYDPFRRLWVFSLRDYKPETVGRCRRYYASSTFDRACNWHWTGQDKKLEPPGREQLPNPSKGRG